MARTKGAKDSKPRKKPIPRGTGGRFQKRTGTECKPFGPEGPTYEIKDATSPLIERPPLPIDDFNAAIAAELGQASLSSPEPGPGTADGIASPSPAQAGGFDPSSLTLEGLSSAWTVPFWALGWILTALRVIPSPDPVTEVGRRRAKDLAKPSYEIYAHYARQWLSLNPQNTVHVAAGVTALNGVGLLPDLTEAIVKSRREWMQRIQRQTQQQPPAQGQGGPAAAGGQ